MADQPFKKNTAATIFLPGLVDQSNTKVFKTAPTIAAGDFKISKDGGAFANPDTLPDVEPDGTTQVRIQLTATEMNADQITVKWQDAAGAEWCDGSLMIFTASAQMADLATASALSTLSGYVDTEVAAIKAKTDNLPSDPADESLLEAAITAATSPLATAANLATLSGYVDTEVAAIKAKTDNLPSDPADESSIQAAIAAISVPSAASVADAVWDEAIAGHLTTGTTGKKLSDASAASTPPTVDEISTAMTEALTQAGIPSTAGLNKYVRRGDTWEISITGLGDLTDVDDIWFTAKEAQYLGEANDNNAMVQVQQTIGLTRFNKAAVAVGDVTDGSIAIVGAATDGAILVTVKADQTTNAPLGMYDYDVQLLTGTDPYTPEAGVAKLFVNVDVTKDIT